MGRRPKPGEAIQVVGHFTDLEAGRAAMGIDWMTRDELAQAIPPAYTEFIGQHLMAHLSAERAAGMTRSVAISKRTVPCAKCGHGHPLWAYDFARDWWACGCGNRCTGKDMRAALQRAAGASRRLSEEKKSQCPFPCC